VLALTAALVGPYFVDWTSYRADFEREAGRILGREVTVRGDASARLLPFPSITFTDVVVAGIKPGEPAMTVETFSMDAELAPFMQGNIHIFDMRLVRPSVVIDVAEDGALDWAVRPSVPLGATHVSLEKLTITEGKAVLRHAASGRTHTLTEVNAELSARSLAGPWRMEGSLRLDGMRTALSISTGAVDENGMRIRVRAQPEAYPFTLETDGTARVEDGRAEYAGNFRLNASALGEQPAEKEGPPAYRVGGNFLFDHAALKVEKFRFETGPLDDPYIAEGSAEFDLGPQPSFFISADGAQVRFDEAISAESGAVSLETRIAAVRDFLLDMPRPAIPGRIEVALPAVVAGDTTIRDVHLHAAPAEGGWAIASLGATLPGRATLEASGDLTVSDDLGFKGSLLLAVGQPSGFAAWLARDVDDVIRRLPAAGFSAKVDLSAEQQLFEDLELILGKAKFTGEIVSRTPANQKPSMSLKLDGNELDVEGMSALASLFISDEGRTRHADRDIEFQIAAGPVTAAGLTAESLDTALRLKDGTLEIDKLSIGGLAGANVSATGSVKNVGTEPAGTIDATIIAADLAPLVEALGERFPNNKIIASLADHSVGYPGLFEDASIRVVGTSAKAGEVLGLAVSASGEAGGTTFSLAGSASDILGGLENSAMKLELSARNDDASALYALAGMPSLPLGMIGQGSAEFSFEGQLAGGGKTKFLFIGDGLSASFQGEAALADEHITLNGSAALVADDLEPWLATAGISLPGFGYGLPVSIKAELDEQEGLLVLSGLTGRVAETTIDGDINAQLREGAPHLTGALQLSNLDLRLVSEMLVSAQALEAAEDGWPTTPFATTVSAPFTAELDLGVTLLTAGGGWHSDDARFTLNLGQDGAAFSRFIGNAYGGQLTGNAEFRNNAGSGMLSGQLKLAGADARILFGDKGLTGEIQLTTTFTANGKSIDGLVSSLAGSGSAHLNGAEIAGVSPDAFADLLKAADERGTEINAETTRQFASSRVRQGSFPVENADVAFTITNGVLRAPPVRLGVPGATLGLEMQANLQQGTFTANSTLTYDPGKHELVGSEPAVRFTASGPFDAIEVTVETDPLGQYFTQRALEREQERVAAMQSALLERQRLRREVRYFTAIEQARIKAEQEAERARIEAERLERLQKQLEEDAARRAEEERTAVEPEQPASAPEPEQKAEPEQTGSPPAFSFDAIRRVIEEAQ